MGYKKATAEGNMPTRCVFDEKHLASAEDQLRGVCPLCWKLIGKPLAHLSGVKRDELAHALATMPEPMRGDLGALGDLTKPTVAWQGIQLALYHGAAAVTYGAEAIETVAERVDQGKLVVAGAFNLATVLGYRAVAERLLSFRMGEGGDLIRIQDAKRGVYEVHAPFSDEWNKISRETRDIFFAAPRKDGRFWWRAFHSSELRRVVNLLQGVFGDQLTLGVDGHVFALPSMPLPKEDDFGKAPTTKPKATGKRYEVPEEIEGIKLGDSIKLPDGSSSTVQFIDPKKRSVGVGATKEGRYVFYSFAEVETVNGRAVAARIMEERKRAARELGQTPREVLEEFNRDIPKEMKDYQLESLAFIEKNRRVILGDEMGLGKGLTSIVAIDTPAIIVCPATLKSMWRDQMVRWRPELVPLVLSITGGEHPDVSDQKKASVFIINYDIVDKHLEWLVEVGAKTLIADEAQYLKNLRIEWSAEKRRFVPGEKSPKRANSFYELHWNIPKLILATGTPILNRAKELFPLLHLCNKQEWSNQRNFEIQYCGGHEDSRQGRRMWNANGRTNSEELHHRVKAKYMVRHTKAMVLKELPAKSRTSITVSLSESARRKYLHITRDFLAWVYAHGGPEKVARAMRAEALTRMTAMRRVSANGKVEAALQWIGSFIESTGFRPLVVAGVHTDALDGIGKGLDEMNRKFDQAQAEGEMPEISRKVRWASIMGRDSNTQRTKTVKKFQEDGVVDVLLFSIPLGTGLTLTRSQDMLFIERMWRPSDQVQMEDRAHRLGQKNTVAITYLDGAGTIDAKLGMMLMDKTETAASIIDGEDLTRNETFFRVFGEMVGKDGKKIDPRKMRSVDSLSDLVDEAELEAIDMAKDLDELVKARQEMEREKAQKPQRFEDEEEESEVDEDVEEYARKLRAKRKLTPNLAFEETYPGQATDRAYYEKMVRENPDFDEILDSMVIDSWNQPL